MSEEATLDSASSTLSPYPIRLDCFEGPLDLLLHLIKENQLDIYNIPVAQVTQQYLCYLEMMETLNLTIAGEFLLMAATLAHIKSQLLLPPEQNQDDPEEEGRDPREELIRRLLEYQKYKEAANALASRPLLYRDVFKREAFRARAEETPGELMEVSVFKLVEAFYRLLENLPLKDPHEVEREAISISDRVQFILEKLRASGSGVLRFQQLFSGTSTRPEVVATFLATLEMLKRGALRVFQASAFEEIQLMGTPMLYGEWTYDGIESYAGQPPADGRPTDVGA